MSITKKEMLVRELFSRRLARLIDSQDIQQNDLARKLGVSESTVGKWLLKKAMPRMGAIQKLADYFEVPKSYFLEEQEMEKTDSEEETPSFSYIHIPVGISAGKLENCEALMTLPRITLPDIILGKYARNPRIMIMHVNGDSMNRVIEDGSVIAVMTELSKSQLQNGDIVVATNGHGYTVKRFYNIKEKESIVLSPDSTDPSFVPIVIPYNSPDTLQIFGKVVMCSMTI